MHIRLIGIVCLCLGTFVVAHDLVTAFAYGEPDASLLAALLRLAAWSGRSEWSAFVAWLAPLATGVAALIVARTRAIP